MIVQWYEEHRRDLPWRNPETSAWGVLVSEVMSQQTPVGRVAPRWREWMERWPAPADLAKAPTAEVLLAWDSLGYPRRALRLKECAQAIVDDHAGEVPADPSVLESLPGVGSYTAAAVASFAFGQRAAVLDVNIRRVLSRVYAGAGHPKPAVSKKELAWAMELVPVERHVAYNAGIMELGALVCTSRNPSCERCPLARQCTWLAAGRPALPGRKPTTQAWAGTDRQLRGAIMATLRQLHREQGTSTMRADLFTASAQEHSPEEVSELPESVARRLEYARSLGTSERLERLLGELIRDGLVAHERSGSISLPE